ncbi:fatty acid--CoA ligase family protein [Streptomyces sp. NBC_01460]|uniref:class I adenylate-forming enzyme family protein n=1 Tax=Streptomyces sp. NBC_01460 TaxID=2903875 RepID=UPI002E37AE77|nr:fatty acid--CoA ligase family protein [Streptomyces sp. NBC_01460]
MDGRDAAVSAAGAPGAVYAAFRTVALDRPGATAVIGPDGSEATYATLLGAVEDAAGRLTEGLAPGEVLGLAAQDPLAFVTVYLAAAKLNTVTVLLDGRASTGQRARDARKFDLARLAVDGAGPGAFALEPAGAPRTGEHGYASDDFVVHCTSGSTGRPKGIVMSQAAVLARVRLWAGETELVPADVVLCALPLWHCHGIDVLTLPALLTGATVVFAHGGRLTGRGLARCVQRHAITVMSGLPVMYRMLTEARGVPATALGSLRLAVSGSAPLATDTQESFLGHYGLPLRQVYGLSEIAVICFDRDYAGNGSIGRPIAGVEYRLDPVRSPEAAAGPAYELSVRGPALARGYYRDAEATAEMFEDGWLRTRDLVRVEPEGWYVLGRHAAFINVAGEKVGPLEVEDALRACPGVLDCAVVGVPDLRTTERVAALLVTGPEFDPDATRRRLGERLRSCQLPQRYEFAAALPRTALGKTDYAAVRELLDTEERDAT